MSGPEKSQGLGRATLQPAAGIADGSGACAVGLDVGSVVASSVVRTYEPAHKNGGCRPSLKTVVMLTTV